MTIDVSGILKELGGRIEVNGEVEIGEFEFSGERYSLEAPLKVSGIISNNGKALVLTADVEAELCTRCARCLDEIIVDAGFSMEESFAQSESKIPEDDEIIVFDGYTIELDDIIEDNLIMNIEGRYLCEEDCKGLCPQCGANLNDGECGCNREFIDPRWSGLADLMNNE